MSDADAQSRKVAAEAEQYLNSDEAKRGHAKGDSGMCAHCFLFSNHVLSVSVPN